MKVWFKDCYKLRRIEYLKKLIFANMHLLSVNDLIISSLSENIMELRMVLIRLNKKYKF